MDPPLARWPGIPKPGKNPMVKKIAYAIGGAVIMLAGISLFFALTEDVLEDEPDLQDSPAT